MRLLLLSIVGACASSQGPWTAPHTEGAGTLPVGMAPPPAALALSSTPWVGGSSAVVTVTGAGPAAIVHLLATPDLTGPPVCPPAAAPTCLALAAPITELGVRTADAGGTATFTLPIPDPPPVPAVRIQAWSEGPFYGLSPGLDPTVTGYLPPLPPSSLCPPPLALVDTSTPDSVVGTGSPAGCTEAVLRAAVSAGGTIAFDCGAAPHTITVGAPLVVSADTVLDGAGAITLSGGGSSRILEVPSSFEQLGPVLTVQRLTLRDGFTTDVPATPSTDRGGAAIYRLGGTLNVLYSRFLDNIGPVDGQDVAGGAIMSIGDGPTTIVGSWFEGNRASNGGALGNLHNPLTVADTVLIRNEATGSGGNPGNGGNGGAVSMDGVGNALELCGVQLRENQAPAFGGGLFRVANAGTPTTTISVSTIADNVLLETPQSLGGGMYLQGDRISLDASAFTGNTSRGAGGLFIGPGTTVDFENSTFADNEARTTLGGGLTLGGDTTGTLSHLTFARNRAPDPLSFAAAIAGGSAGVTLRSSVVADHSAGNIWVSLSCNQVLGDGGGNVQWPDRMESGLYDTPCAAGVTWMDPGLGPLGDHGGPTWTVPVAAGGPAVGAASGCPPVDQRGMPRGEPCDAGAYEGP